MTTHWPRITVITVVRNAAATLPRAIESLKAQDYPNLEYLVLDAVSTDGTLDIIKANESFISHWRSCRDDGPNDAYNEGICRSTGEIIALLNADDWYEPGILRQVGAAFRDHPEADMVTCIAQVWRKDAAGNEQHVKSFTGRSLELNPEGSPIPNARFFRRTLFERFGHFAVTNTAGQRYIASDLEYLLRLSREKLVNHILAVPGYNYLMHEGSITMAENPARMRQMYEERAALAEQYFGSPELAPYRSRLKRWHRRGTTRAFYWHMTEKNFKSAWKEAKRGIAVSPVGWIADVARLGITGRFRKL